jgi:hypothetical protein
LAHLSVVLSRVTQLTPDKLLWFFCISSAPIHTRIFFICRSSDNDVKGFIAACINDVRVQIGEVRRLEGLAGASEFVVRGRRKKQFGAHSRDKRMGDSIDVYVTWGGERGDVGRFWNELVADCRRR